MEFEEREVTSTAGSLEETRREWQAYRERVAGEAFDRAQQQFNDVIDATRQFRAFCMRRIRARRPAINGADLFFAAFGAIASRIPGIGVAIELAKQIYRSELTPPSAESQLEDFVDQIVADVTTKTNNAARAIQQNVRTNQEWERIISDTWASSLDATAGEACDALGLGAYTDFRAPLLEALINEYFELEVAVDPNRSFIRSTGMMLYGHPMGGYRIEAREQAGRVYQTR